MSSDVVVDGSRIVGEIIHVDGVVAHFESL